MNNQNESSQKSAGKRKSKLHQSTMWLSGVLAAAVIIAGLVNAWVTSQTAIAQSPRSTEPQEAREDLYGSAMDYATVRSAPQRTNRTAAVSSDSLPASGYRPPSAATTPDRVQTNGALAQASSNRLRSDSSGASTNQYGSRPVRNSVPNQYGGQMSTSAFAPSGLNTSMPISADQHAINNLVATLRSNDRRDPRSADNAAASRQQLEGLVAKQFADRHKQQANKIAKLEHDLDEAKKVHALRDENKAEIVSRRVKELLSEPDPLGWEPDAIPSASNPGQFRDRQLTVRGGVTTTTSGFPPAQDFKPAQSFSTTRGALDSRSAGQRTQELKPPSAAAPTQPANPTQSGFGLPPTPRQPSSFAEPPARPTPAAGARRSAGKDPFSPSLPPVPVSPRSQPSFSDEPRLGAQPQRLSSRTQDARWADMPRVPASAQFNSTSSARSTPSADQVLGLPDEIKLQELRVKQLQALYKKGATPQYELQKAEMQLNILKAKFAFARQAAASDLEAQQQTLDLLKQQLAFAQRRLEFSKEAYSNGITDEPATLDRQTELLKLNAEIIEAQRRISTTTSLLDHLFGGDAESATETSQSSDLELSPKPLSTTADRLPNANPGSSDDLPGTPAATPSLPTSGSVPTPPADSDLLLEAPAAPAILSDPLSPSSPDDPEPAEPDSAELDELEPVSVGATSDDDQ